MVYRVEIGHPSVEEPAPPAACGLASPHDVHQMSTGVTQSICSAARCRLSSPCFPLGPVRLDLGPALALTLKEGVVSQENVHGWWFVSTAEEQGWVPATYLDSQNRLIPTRGVRSQRSLTVEDSPAEISMTTRGPRACSPESSCPRKSSFYQLEASGPFLKTPTWS
ncbi:SH3 and PX domain-containing protein 2A [Liparis tanakae]|uniref:SH3 and PX domain-containing protein 2A n=1 Tax=Liparis tanakae TaxID=230148 RepID=A0A4Z2IJC1_9TELE|nr:SH3 and PX domain-containing protein 2A [Liparis tanakae]